MHITIIDDEKLLGAKMKKKIEQEGYAVSAFTSYADFMSHGDSSSQLYIIDVSLGDGSGFDIIMWLRKKAGCKAPIIIMSGYGDSERIIYGLDIGADDYLTKPFIPEELIARVKALLRRPQSIVTETILTHKSISFNINTKEIHVGTHRVYLTQKESMLLEFFLARKNKVVNREELINHIWGGHHIGDVSDNTINVTLSKIRKKIGGDFALKSMYNQGYILE